MSSVKVLHVMGGIARAAGGPSRSVPLQMMSLTEAGVQCDLMVPCEVSAPSDEARSLRSRGVRTIRIAVGDSPGDLMWSGTVRQAMGERIRAYDLVHIHGLWLPICHLAARMAMQVAVPTVLSPRGMLEPWALRHSWPKKIAAWVVYQRGDICRARLLHATARAEAEQFRRMNIPVPSVVIPNGISCPVVRPVRKASRLRRILFLSRIHPKKGLANLIHALAEAKPILEKRDWRLVVAGYDEGGHRSAIEGLVRELGMRHLVEFRGSVEGISKWRLYASSDLFVLPSYSENFGMVVGEALANGIPVITTRGVPWPELPVVGCGWWVPVGVAPLAKALREALSMSPRLLKAMGSRGREHIRRHYTWKPLALEMRSAYEWALGDGPKPQCAVVRRR